MRFRLSEAGTVAAAGGAVPGAVGESPANWRVAELRTRVAEELRTRTADR